MRLLCSSEKCLDSGFSMNRSSNNKTVTQNIWTIVHVESALQLLDTELLNWMLLLWRHFGLFCGRRKNS